MAHLKTVAHLKYSTHFSFVFQHELSGRFHCIKYGRNGFAWEVFDESDLDLLEEYSSQDLPEGTWGVVVDGD